MSVNRTRLLFADDTDLLARARLGIVNRPEFDVVMAASTDEALQLAADAPPPGAVVLPASGTIDGLQVCRSVKAAANGRVVPVILALAADDSSKRDACFAAGADDVLFAPVEAADITTRLDRSTSGFRSAPRAEVEIVVRLASPTGSAVLDAAGSQISREAVQVTLPAGTPPLAAGQLIRAVFTLYEGGTLQVWARAAATTDPPRVVLRFVGLTEPERRAIDYFVDFYVKRTAAEPSPAVKGGGGSVEELLLSSEIPEARPVRTPTPSRASAAAPAAPALDPAEAVRLICEATLSQLADAAGRFAAGRDAPLPPGFDVGRVRSCLTKLSATETSALRGTTMYNNLLGDLRNAAASRLRLGELTAVMREAGNRLDKRGAEKAAVAALTEAQQIHNILDSGTQDMIKAGNTAAMRDVQPVKAGLLTACVDLKTVLDRDVLGKEAPGLVKSTAAPKPAQGPAKFDPAQKVERTTKESKSKDVVPASGRSRKMMLGVLFVALFGGAIWSNRHRFGGGPVAPPIFRPETVLFEVQGVRVWNSMPGTDSITWIIDGSWAGASEEARAAALDEMARRSTGMKRMRVIDYNAKELATRELQ